MNTTNIKDKSVQLAEEIKSYLEKIFGALSQTVELEVVNEEYEVWVNVGHCFLVYVDFREKKVESILDDEMIKDYLFDIVGIKHIPGVYMYKDGSGEPDSEEEIEICTKESTLMAASEVATLYAKMVIDGVCEGIEEQKMLDDMENPDGEES
jgi:hypothetical protein